ncbi:hypothetical protein [Nocardioides immobilis]|nr:hypothetical protein [Nocardioides immobilis]
MIADLTNTTSVPRFPSNNLARGAARNEQVGRRFDSDRRLA